MQGNVVTHTGPTALVGFTLLPTGLSQWIHLAILILNLSFLLNWKCNSRCAILRGFAIWAKFSFALGFGFDIFTATSCQDAKFFTGMLSLLMIKRIITNFFCVIQIKLGISTYLPVAKSVSFSCSGYLSHTSKHTSHDGRSDQVRIHFPTSYLLTFWEKWLQVYLQGGWKVRICNFSIF